MSNTINYVGIDVSKKDFYACFDETSPAERFHNSIPGVNALLRRLAKENFHPQDTLLGLESTGSYHLRLCLYGNRVGFPVKILNPLIVKKYNQTKLRKVKTDKKDASLIRYCLIR